MQSLKPWGVAFYSLIVRNLKQVARNLKNREYLERESMTNWEEVNHKARKTLLFCKNWEDVKEKAIVRQYERKIFLKLFLMKTYTQARKEMTKKFGYKQRDLEAPEHLKCKFLNFTLVLQTSTLA